MIRALEKGRKKLKAGSIKVEDVNGEIKPDF